MRFASITHAAGLSSTGEAELDAALPLRESYDVPAETAAAVSATRVPPVARVIAVGTTVVRALESAAPSHGGVLRRMNRDGRQRDTDLVVGGGHALQVVDAIFTGMHEPGTSHDALCRPRAPRACCSGAFWGAQAWGFLGHEFGASMLVGAGVLGGPGP